MFISIYLKSSNILYLNVLNSYFRIDIFMFISIYLKSSNILYLNFLNSYGDIFKKIQISCTCISYESLLL